MPTPAERLAMLMKVYGDSTRIAGERCGIDHTTITRVRNGDTENPATLERIAEGYGVPLSWFRGEPDLATDFAMAVLARPLPERIEFIWDRERRIGFALAFLTTYAPKPHTVPGLAALLGLSLAEVEGILQHRRGSVDSLKLDSLCTKTGLPHHWLRTGLVGREDEEALLAGLAEWALTSLLARVGVEIEQQQMQKAVRAMI